MTHTNDGGPAFPFEFHNQTSRHQESFFDGRAAVAPNGSEQYGGMSLRDYFAAKALGHVMQFVDTATPSTIARLSYEIADSMLAERTK
jgi:hypothetical protein